MEEWNERVVGCETVSDEDPSVGAIGGDGNSDRCSLIVVGKPLAQQLDVCEVSRPLVARGAT